MHLHGINSICLFLTFPIQIQKIISRYDWNATDLHGEQPHEPPEFAHTKHYLGVRCVLFKMQRLSVSLIPLLHFSRLDSNILWIIQVCPTQGYFLDLLNKCEGKTNFLSILWECVTLLTAMELCRRKAVFAVHVYSPQTANVPTLICDLSQNTPENPFISVIVSFLCPLYMYEVNSRLSKEKSELFKDYYLAWMCLYFLSAILCCLALTLYNLAASEILFAVSLDTH